jgi:hypothetical protein
MKYLLSISTILCYIFRLLWSHHQGNSQLTCSYITKNNIKHLLRKNENRNERYNLSGVYQLQCADCPLKYIGQNWLIFEIRFKEHIRDIKNNRQNSKFAQHIVDTTHEYRTIDQKMENLHIVKKDENWISTKDFIYMKSVKKYAIKRQFYRYI